LAIISINVNAQLLVELTLACRCVAQPQTHFRRLMCTWQTSFSCFDWQFVDFTVEISCSFLTEDNGVGLMAKAARPHELCKKYLMWN